MRKISSRTMFCGLKGTNQEIQGLLKNNENQIMLTQAYQCLPAEDFPINGIAMYLQGSSVEDIINYAKQINATQIGRISHVVVNGGSVPTICFDAVCKGDAYEVACVLIKTLKQKPIKYLEDCFVFNQSISSPTCHICGVFNLQDIPKDGDVVAILKPLWFEFQEITTKNMRKLSGFIRIKFVQTGLNLIE